MTTIPPLLTIPVAGAILNFAPATSYRTIGKILPRAPIPGRHRILLSDLERLIGRAVTEEDYARAVAKAHGKPTTAPDNTDTASLVQSEADDHSSGND